MSRGSWIFILSLLGMIGSWFGTVLYPQIQLGRMVETRTVPDGQVYPVARPGLAAQGREVYRSQGCYTCHSQQVRQEGVSVGLAITKVGTNQTALVEAILRIAPQWRRDQVTAGLERLPFQVMDGVAAAEAERARRPLEAAGATTMVTVRPVGADLARGWGLRRSVAADFLWDHPVMLGSQRVGPDLAGVGSRLPDENWLLVHLWDPQIHTPGSMMPPYRYLFEVRPAAEVASQDALLLPEGKGPGPGKVVVPRPEARALVAYLRSLEAKAPLFETPVILPAGLSGTSALSVHAAVERP
ncbi:MAG: cbb3-type cytochrome c oxidase subunit II [Verrucomicrobiota bacterium]|nr:cbb3-type cytochrome c oxidase subunit II [Limisphaera sp.]MDW8381140.1 cbb3-type cytochrome c oxidase subunit II [Verrucomicrobiota bacterium]